MSEYVNEIYGYLKDLERRHAVSKEYLDASKTDINSSMRAILIDW